MLQAVVSFPLQQNHNCAAWDYGATDSSARWLEVVLILPVGGPGNNTVPMINESVENMAHYRIKSGLNDQGGQKFCNPQ
jgi:hypothetical protein